MFAVHGQRADDRRDVGVQRVAQLLQLAGHLTAPAGSTLI
jgi:hypothetical protein